MRIFYHVMSAPAPLGLLFLATTERGLRYVEFMDRRSLKRTIASHAADNPGATWEPSVREMRPLAEQIEQYFCGTQKAFRVPLDPAGTEHQLRVWKALAAIPYGETRSYGDVARAIGEPRGARAVGLAANHNPLVILVPCHRVIGADGKLVGYVGGVARKKALLAIEARFRALQDVDGDRVIEQLHRKVSRAADRVRARKAPKPAAKPAKAAPRKRAPAPATVVRNAAASSAAVAPAVAASPPNTRRLSAAPARRPALKG
jgi:methylated-DNA-[protein]-cysteine S-methyltransferase